MEKIMSSISKTMITTVGNGFVDDMDLLAANDTKLQTTASTTQSM